MKTKYLVYFFVVALECLPLYVSTEHCHKVNFQSFDDNYINKDIDMCTMFMQSYSDSVNMKMSLIDYLLEYIPQTYVDDGRLRLLTQYERNYTFILASTVDRAKIENEHHNKNKYKQQTHDQFEDNNRIVADDADHGLQYISVNWDQSFHELVKDITTKFDIIPNCNSIITFYLTFPSYPENDLLSIFFKQFQNTSNQTVSSSLNDNNNLYYRNDVHPSFLPLVDSLPLTIFQKLLQQHSNVRFIFCGHGLGGAVAQLSTLHLLSTKTNLYPVRLRSISMGSLFFAQEGTIKFIQNHNLKNHFIHIHHEMDIVPSLFNIAELLSRIDQSDGTKSNQGLWSRIKYYLRFFGNKIEKDSSHLNDILIWLCQSLTAHFPNLNSKICEPSTVKTTVDLVKQCLKYVQDLSNTKRRTELIYRPIGIFNLIIFQEYDYTWHLINVQNMEALDNYLNVILKTDLNNAKQIFVYHSISTYMMDLQRCNQQKSDSIHIKSISTVVSSFANDNKLKSETSSNYSIITPLPFRFQSGTSYMNMIAIAPVFSSEFSTLSSSEYHNLKRRFLSAIKHRTGLSENTMINKNKKSSTVMSIYDICLTIYETSGMDARMELMKLQLDQRMLVPILVSRKNISSPIVSQSYSLTFRSYIKTLGLVETAVLRPEENILAMDLLLLRIGLISTVSEENSGMTDLIKNVFQATSMRQPIQGMGDGIKANTVAEAGYGFLPNDSSKSSYQPVILVHIVGDYRSLMLFLDKYVDVLIVEYNDNNPSPVLLDHNPQSQPSRVRRIIQWKYTTNRKFKEIIHTDRSYQIYEFEGSITAVTVPIQQNLLDIASDSSLYRHSVDSSFPLGPRLIDLIQDKELFIDDDIPLLHIETVFKNINTSELRKDKFHLQQSYTKEAESHLERDNPAVQLNSIRIQELEANIRRERNIRLNTYKKVSETPILESFISLIAELNDEKRYIQKRQFEFTLSQYNEETISSLRKKKDELFTIMETTKQAVLLANEKSSSIVSNLESDKEEAITNYYNAKKDYIDSSLIVEHFWRELSHLYLVNKTQYHQFPDYAAQHLIDGFSLELVDGDSMLLNFQWITDVFNSLDTKLNNALGRSARILTLSICGPQSSGKSFLLKTMFGIRVRSSVGACTQGVNLMLVKAFHKDYDYVLLLDTEGLRAPEFSSMSNSEMRDNTLATFAVLPADGTILLNKGEVNQALEEIFPVVLYLYATSSLSKMLGGEVPSKLFFVYNQIDPSQPQKGKELLQDLATRFYNVTDKIIQLASSERVPFHGFQQCRLDLNNMSNSDFRILPTNVNNPPINHPDYSFGEKSLNLRQWIDLRITNKSDNRPWKARSISNIARYFEVVSDMIRQAPHIIGVGTPLEIWATNELNRQIQEIKQDLSSIYNMTRSRVESEVITNYTNSPSISSTVTLSLDDIAEIIKSTHANVSHLMQNAIQEAYEQICRLVKGTRRENRYLNDWDDFVKDKEDQSRKILAKKIGLEISNFEFHAKTIEKMRRDFIHICNEKECTNLTESDKKKIFGEILDKRIKEIEELYRHGIINVTNYIKAIYNQSKIIEKVRIFDDINQFCYKNGSSKQSISDNNHSIHVKQDLSTADRADFQYRSFVETKKFNESIGEIKSIIDTLVTNVIHYEPSIVDKVLGSIEKIITQRSIVQLATQKAVHSETYCYLEYRLTAIQDEWDDKHNRTKLLEKNYNDLWEFYQNVTAGVRGVKLFQLVIFNAINLSWRNAFIDILVQDVATEVAKQNWIRNSDILHAKMNQEKIMILEDKNKGITVLLDETRSAGEFYRKSVIKWIQVHVENNINDTWMAFYDNAMRAIEKAKDRAKLSSNDSLNIFLQTLRNRGVSGLPSSITFHLPIDTSTFGNADNLTNEIFDAMADTLKKAIPFIGSPEYLHLSKEDLANSVLNKIRDTAATDKTKPRCNHACKICGAPCFHHSGHSELHDFHHQPAGLAGTRDVHTNFIAHETCHEAFKKDYNFTIDGNVYHPFREFPKVLGYEVPNDASHRDLLGEFLMSKYHKDIAKYYKCETDLSVPIASEEYTLEDIKKKIEELLK